MAQSLLNIFFYCFFRDGLVLTLTLAQDLLLLLLLERVWLVRAASWERGVFTFVSIKLDQLLTVTYSILEDRLLLEVVNKRACETSTIYAHKLRANVFETDRFFEYSTHLVMVCLKSVSKAKLHD